MEVAVLEGTAPNMPKMSELKVGLRVLFFTRNLGDILGGLVGCQQAEVEELRHREKAVFFWCFKWQGPLEVDVAPKRVATRN